MSTSLIALSPDLKRLRDEGYDVKIEAAAVVVSQIPYVTTERKVKRATLRSPLRQAGDKLLSPSPHTVAFNGECCPCDANGSPLAQMVPGGTVSQFQTLSRKPKRGHYEDYYEQMTTYIALMAGPAQIIDPAVTAKVISVIETNEEESVFKYLDTASSRAGITEVSKKLELSRVAIIGLGGTGSYILDLVSKTPVEQIDIYDGDVMLTHNAFRTPGAASLEELRGIPKKVAYLAAKYSNMHRGIKPHEDPIDESNVDTLNGTDFVFLAMDPGKIRSLIMRKLLDMGIPFIDVGMGITLVPESKSLRGTLRTTIATKDQHDHLDALLPSREGNEKNEYDQNIQIAELNALNAALAVIKWKKSVGFYADTGNEHHSLYKLSSNNILNGAEG